MITNNEIQEAEQTCLELGLRPNRIYEFCLAAEINKKVKELLTNLNIKND